MAWMTTSATRAGRWAVSCRSPTCTWSPPTSTATGGLTCGTRTTTMTGTSTRTTTFPSTRGTGSTTTATGLGSTWTRMTMTPTSPRSTRTPSRSGRTQRKRHAGPSGGAASPSQATTMAMGSAMRSTMTSMGTGGTTPTSASAQASRTQPNGAVSRYSVARAFPLGHMKVRRAVMTSNYRSTG